MNSQSYELPPRLRSRTLREGVGVRGEVRFGAPPAVRLLPVLIVIALVMVGFKVQVIVRDVADTSFMSFVMSQSTALAQVAAPNPAAPVPAQGAPAAGASPEGPVEADAGPPLPLNFDPANLTRAEVDTLQRLAERRETIERRERETQAKEGLLMAAEARIDGKIAQLQDLEKNIQSLLTQYDAQKEEEIDQLVRIYSAMKPKDAARIFDSLEMPILVGVIQKMRDAKVAPIMAAMDSRKATSLTEELTVRKQLTAGPLPAPRAGGQ
jgi:flagellar motility protein MotE (MotC chaperone)